MKNWPPLHTAAYNLDSESVLEILAVGTPPDLRDEDGYTPLLWACFRALVADPLPVIKGLIDAGADPNALTADGKANCLILAAQSWSEPAVAALLVGGANGNARADGVTALMVAARDGKANIVKLLLQSGADPSVRCGSFDASDYARYGGHDELAAELDAAARKITRSRPLAVSKRSAHDT
jgi:uncharacterized protein